MTTKKVPTVAKVQEMIDDSIKNSITETKVQEMISNSVGNMNPYNWIKYITFDKINIDCSLALNISYGNGTYVCINNYSAFYSTNGTDWTEVVLETQATSICYGNDNSGVGKFVIMGKDKYCLYSTDGITWTKSDEFSEYFNGAYICSGNNTYVGMSNFDHTIYYSYDAKKWYKVSNTSLAKTKDLCFGNNIFMMLTDGYISSSTNGKNWTQIGPISDGMNKIAYVNNMFIMYKDNSPDIIISYDGENLYGPYTTNLPSDSYKKFIYCSGAYIAVFVSSVYYSIDCIYWVKLQLSDCSNLKDGCFGQNRIFILSNSYLYLSNEIIIDDVVIKSCVKQIAYPIGSIYMSVNNTNPSTFIGGTWESLTSPITGSYAWKRTA